MNENQTNQNMNTTTNVTTNTNTVLPNETSVNAQNISAQVPGVEQPVVNSTSVDGVSVEGTSSDVVSSSTTPTTNITETISSSGSMLASGTPSSSANVNPILKETSKVSFNNTPQEETQVVSDNSVSPMEEQKKEPKSKSLIPLIIFFIFLFAFVFFLPDINDYFKEKEGKKKIEEFDRELREEEEKQRKEEEEAKKQEEQNQKEEETYKTLTCVSLPKTTLNTNVVTTQELTYGSGKLKSVKIIKSTEYTTLDAAYETAKKECENKTILVASIEGYEFSCAVSELSMEESNLFELKDFKSQTLTKEDGTTEEISTTYVYDTPIERVQKDLEAEGYTCK